MLDNPTDGNTRWDLMTLDYRLIIVRHPELVNWYRATLSLNRNRYTRQSALPDQQPYMDAPLLLCPWGDQLETPVVPITDSKGLGCAYFWLR